MADPTYVSNERICFGDLEIMLMSGASSEALSQRDDIYYMMKSLPYLESYRMVRDALRGSSGGQERRNVMEVGVFRGGSAPFLHRYFDADRLVCVDLLKEVVPLTRYWRQTAPALQVHYGVDQSDKDAMRQIAATEFSGPIDLVVDDASHIYGPTKATFEAVFPFLRPGGVYVIEDWAWSHDKAAQQAAHFWSGMDSLTTLIFELVAAYGSADGLLSSIGFGPGLMWVVKGWLTVPQQDFALERHINLRGRTLAKL